MPTECINCNGARFDQFMDETFYCPKYPGTWELYKQTRQCTYQSLTQEEVESTRIRSGFKEVTCDQCEEMNKDFGVVGNCSVCHEQGRCVVWVY